MSVIETDCLCMCCVTNGNVLWVINGSFNFTDDYQFNQFKLSLQCAFEMIHDYRVPVILTYEEYHQMVNLIKDLEL